MTVRVLIADDQPMYRVGLAAILQAQPDIEVVAEAADGEQAMRRAQQARPDVVFMDVRMPGMDGITATRQLTDVEAGRYSPRVIMLTTFDIDDYVFDALRAGASGFLLKDATPEQLVDAARVVAQGDALLAPRATQQLIETFVAGLPAPPPATDPLTALTEREREVFLLIAAGRSNTEIAAELFIAEQTAKTHVSRVLTKLHLRDRVQAVVLAYETGVVHRGR